jgi:hypothetical protein
MDDFIRHGDVEALIIKILEETPELPAGVRIAPDLRGYTDSMTWVTVSQEGSNKAQWNVINKPRIDVDVRSTRRSLARDVAEICEAAIFRATNARAFGASISQVKEEMGITRIPDAKDDASYRYVFSLRVVTMIDPETQTTLPL